MKNILKKSSLNGLKHKILKTKSTLNKRFNINIRREKKCLKIIREQKTTQPSQENLVKLETEKVNKVLQHIPRDNITELNKLIYAISKLVNNRIGIPVRNPNRNAKPRLVMSL